MIQYNNIFFFQVKTALNTGHVFDVIVLKLTFIFRIGFKSNERVVHRRHISRGVGKTETVRYLCQIFHISIDNQTTIAN